MRIASLLLAGLLALSVSGAASADEAKDPAKAPAAAKPAAAANTAKAELLKELQAAKAKLADSKKALAEAKKGKDKDAITKAQEQVKADGKAIHEVEMKLSELKKAASGKTPGVVSPGKAEAK